MVTCPTHAPVKLASTRTGAETVLGAVPFNWTLEGFAVAVAIHGAASIGGASRLPVIVKVYSLLVVTDTVIAAAECAGRIPGGADPVVQPTGGTFSPRATTIRF